MIPSPPLCLGLQTLSQAAKELHFPPCSVFFVHRHLLLSLSRSSRIFGGNRSAQSAKIMSEVMIVFRRESLDPYDIRDNVEVSLLSILQTMGIRSWTEGFEVPSGNPRYVNGILPIVHPKIAARSVLRASSQLIGIKVDL